MDDDRNLPAFTWPDWRLFCEFRAPVVALHAAAGLLYVELADRSTWTVDRHGTATILTDPELFID